MGVDYRKLLAFYIQHVGEQEGTDFISYFQSFGPITDEDVLAIRRLSGWSDDGKTFDRNKAEAILKEWQ